jgi:hypothetical protein
MSAANVLIALELLSNITTIAAEISNAIATARRDGRDISNAELMEFVDRRREAIEKMESTE